MKIEFIPSNPQVDFILDSPKPSKNYIPQWYKNIKVGNIGFNENGQFEDLKNVKNCVPFLDSFTHGYMQSTWCDIYISAKDGKISYSASTGNTLPNIMQHRDKSTPIDTNDFYEKTEFVWFVHWIPKLPKGWSLLIVPPLNHLDLPFTTTSGIIDADDFFHVRSGNLPFYLKKNFEGIIPAGTPMYQMIPIKRESWKSEKIKYNEDLVIKNSANFVRYIANGYRRYFWKKKSFE